MKINNRIIKTIAVALALLTVIPALAACGKNGVGNNENNAYEKDFTIVCSAFPQYDWIRVLLGDRIEKFDISLLSDKGADMHSYQPTAADMKKIGSADIFIYVGGTGETWVDNVKKTVGSDKTVFLGLTDALKSSLLEEETALEGEEHGNGEPEYDEHVWLSVKNAEKLTAFIASELTKLDPDGKETYETTLKEYLLQLAALDAEYKKAVLNGKRDTVIFADRFPFLYMMKDYGLKYYAAFAGCSSESEASFKTVTALSKAADEINTNCILVTETSDGAIADAVISGMTLKGCDKAVMNSMQSVKAADAAGQTYIGIMTENLASLKKALG